MAIFFISLLLPRPSFFHYYSFFFLHFSCLLFIISSFFVCRLTYFIVYLCFFLTLLHSSLFFLVSCMALLPTFFTISHFSSFPLLPSFNFPSSYIILLFSLFIDFFFPLFFFSFLLPLLSCCFFLSSSIFLSHRRFGPAVSGNKFFIVGL